MSTASIVHVALTGSARDLTKAFKEAELGADEAAGGIGDKFDKGSSRVGGIFHKMSSDLQSWGVPFAGSLDKVGNHLDEASTKGKGFSETLSTMGGVALTSGVAAVAAVGAESVKMAMGFQTSMTALTTGAGETQANLSKVSSGILSMAGTVGTSTQDLASGMYLVESAGYHGAAGLSVLKAAAEGAKVGNADLATVADAVTSSLNAYGLKGKDATSVTNQLIATVAAGKMHMQDLAGALSAVLPVAAAAHVSLADVGGAIATMTSQGASAAQASQDLANTIRSLSNPSQVQIAEMEQLGLSSNDVSTKLGKRGLTGTLSVLTEAITSKMGPSGTVLLNSFKQSEAAANDAKVMLDQMPASLQSVAKGYLSGSITAKDWRADLKGMGVDQAQMAREFARTVDKSRGFNDTLRSGSPAAQTFNAALSKVIGGSTGLNVALQLTGSHMATFVTNTASVYKASVRSGQGVTGFSQVQKDLSFQMAQVKDGVQALGIRFGMFLIPILEKVIHAALGVVSWLTKHKDIAIALAGVIGGVLAVAIGAFVVNMGVKLVGSISDAGKAMGNLISKVLPDFITGMGETEAAEGELAATSEETGAASSAAFGPVGLAIMAIVAIGYLVVKHWKTILGWLKDVWNAIKGAALTVFDWLKDFFKKWGLYILGALMGPVGLLAVFLFKHWNTIKTDAVKIWNDVIKFLESIPGRIWNVFKTANMWLFDAGKNIIMGLIHGVTNMAGKAVDAVKHIGSSILHAVTSFFGIFSPSKVFADIGGNLMLGLAGGINSKAGVATAAMDGVNKKLLSRAPAASASRGGGSARGAGAAHGNTTQTINVNVATNADPHKIGREVGWAMKRHR